MLITNISFESVEWLSENGHLRSCRRSKDVYIPPHLKESRFSFSYNDWVEYTKQTGELLESDFIINSVRGFDVEVDFVDGTFPDEIVNKLKVAGYGREEY